MAGGVEDHESLDLFAELGCDGAQGFHIARPVSVAELPGVIGELRGRQ